MKYRTQKQRSEFCNTAHEWHPAIKYLTFLLTLFAQTSLFQGSLLLKFLSMYQWNSTGKDRCSMLSSLLQHFQDADHWPDEARFISSHWQIVLLSHQSPQNNSSVHSKDLPVTGKWNTAILLNQLTRQHWKKWKLQALLYCTLDTEHHDWKGRTNSPSQHPQCHPSYCTWCFQILGVFRSSSLSTMWWKDQKDPFVSSFTPTEISQLHKAQAWRHFTCPSIICIIVQLTQPLQVLCIDDGGPLHIKRITLFENCFLVLLG